MKRAMYIISVFLVCTPFISPIFSTATPNNAEPDYWPTDHWQISTPEEQGMNNDTLLEMDEYIDTSDWALRVDSLLIIRNGYIVYQRYRDDHRQFYPHHIYSCTKVFTSSLIGICLDEGYINSLDDKVIDYFPDLTFQNMNSMKENITIRHLLTMSAGLEWFDNDDYYAMMAADHPVEYVLSQPMVAEPGQVWNYNTGCSHVLSYIISNVTGLRTADFAETALFGPLGIEDYNWYQDSLGTSNGGTLLYLTSRDMARLGYLYLNNGTWNGTQIITKDYVVAATQSQIGFEQGAYFDGYGYKWWIPTWSSSFGARGTNDQNILVIPDENLIVVSTGNNPFPFETLVEDYILPATITTPSPWGPWIIGGAGLLIVVVAGVGMLILVKRKKFPVGQ